MTLACAGPDRAIRFYDLPSGKEVAALKGHTGLICEIAYSPDGKMLASAATDTTALIWDVGSFPKPSARVKKPNSADTWKELASAEASKAFAAICDLVASPAEGVKLLGTQLTAEAHIDNAILEKLAAERDDNQFKVRQNAMAELSAIGKRAGPAIERALAKSPSTEALKRLRDLREKIIEAPIQGEELRQYRAVEAMGWMGTPEARQSLASLASGPDGAFLTEIAKSALRKK
jgi:hypothetical protein